MKINNKLTKQGTILWTNPNPTSSFEAQTITLSSDNYDFYEVYCTYNNSSARHYLNSWKTIKGNGIVMSETGYSTGLLVRRKIDVTDNSHLLIFDSKAGNDTNNTYLIPVYVIGYKTNINL